MITALCPTYGRFSLLRDAVACFLLQTYRPRRLLILNDAPEPIHLCEGGNTLRLPGCTVEVWNANTRYETLGHKRQALLTAACGDPRPVEGGISDGQTDQSHSTPRPRRLAAHWDDDDWYLPWHLRQCVEALTEAGDARCVKPAGAWWVRGQRDSVIAEGPCHNAFEGQMVFERRAAIDLGGYTLKDSGQAKDLMAAFDRQGAFECFEPDLISYCYRWSDGVRHVSACQDGKSWAEGNDDFGDGKPLIPSGPDPTRWAMDRMHAPLQRLLDTLESEVSLARRARIEAALNAAYN